MGLKELGINLSNDEEIMAENSFSYSILLFFIKYEMYVTNKRFIANVPNVLLGVLPLGRNLSTFPLRNIALIQTKTRFRIFLMFLAAIFIFLGLGNLTKSIGGLVFLIIGVIIGILSVPTVILVQASSATDFKPEIAFWDKEKALRLIHQANETIAEL